MPVTNFWLSSTATFSEGWSDLNAGLMNPGRVRVPADRDVQAHRRGDRADRRIGADHGGEIHRPALRGAQGIEHQHLVVRLLHADIDFCGLSGDVLVGRASRDQRVPPAPPRSPAPQRSPSPRRSRLTLARLDRHHARELEQPRVGRARAAGDLGERRGDDFVAQDADQHAVPAAARGSRPPPRPGAWRARGRRRWATPPRTTWPRRVTRSSKPIELALRRRSAP